MTSIFVRMFIVAHIAAGELGDRVRRSGRDRGATAVEYGLLVALIAIVIIGGVTLLGDRLGGLFNTVAGLLPGVDG
jgi:pilus assembly protein Flp/PilA